MQAVGFRIWDVGIRISDLGFRMVKFRVYVLKCAFGRQKCGDERPDPKYQGRRVE